MRGVLSHNKLSNDFIAESVDILNEMRLIFYLYLLFSLLVFALPGHPKLLLHVASFSFCPPTSFP